jgi:hypothetical protein
MTHQFKFGDRVRLKDNKDGKQFVFLRGFLSSCTIASSDGTTQDCLQTKIYLCETEPHPDTVRLDWVEKQRATLYHNALEDIKYGGIAPVEVKAAAQSEYFGGSTVRQAIDAVMSMQAAEAV